MAVCSSYANGPRPYRNCSWLATLQEACTSNHLQWRSPHPSERISKVRHAVTYSRHWLQFRREWLLLYNFSGILFAALPSQHPAVAVVLKMQRTVDCSSHCYPQMLLSEKVRSSCIALGGALQSMRAPRVHGASMLGGTRTDVLCRPNAQ